MSSLSFLNILGNTKNLFNTFRIKYFKPTILIGCGLYCYSLKFKSNSTVFCEDEGQIKNNLKNRICASESNSNNPMEDRYNFVQLKNLDGFMIEVYDGHRGHQVAEYASKNLHLYFDEIYEEIKHERLPEEEKIVKSINFAFHKVEKEYLKIAKAAFSVGFPQVGFPGACALVIIVKDNKIYVANCGDSKAKLFRDNHGELTPIKLTRVLNAVSKKEKERLKREFSDEDIYVCWDKDQKVCYVKNKLMPTWSLGDYHLKYKDFADTEFKLSPKYDGTVKNFNGPYINYYPEVKIFELNENDKYIVLGTDGLWDELNGNEVARILVQKSIQKSKLSDILLNSAIEKASKKANMSVSEVIALPCKEKRDIVDDITVVVVDLKNQFIHKNKI